uniref:Transcription factor grauzone n=1 Tax=Anopheles minimus TaxID=112268 RepID=A0A182WQS9_9DIPT
MSFKKVRRINNITTLQINNNAKTSSNSTTATMLREKCRLCLGRIGFRKCCSIADITFSQMLGSVFSFPIPPTEPNLPTTVCAGCLTSVRIFHEYSEMVQKNQNILLQESVHLVENEAEDKRYEKAPARIELIENVTDSIIEEHLIEASETMSDDKGDSQSDEDMENTVLEVGLLDGENEKLNDQSGKEKPKLHENDRIIQEFFTMHCEICPTGTEQHFDRFHALQLHYRKQHQCRGYLRCCGKQFFRRCRAMEHIASHRGIIRCELCDKSFNSKSYLLRHMAEQHREAQQDKTYACEHCARSFHTKRQRDGHRIVHNTTKCTVCGKSVNTRYIKRHIAQVHESTRKCYMCDLCGQDFSGSMALDRHIKQHQGIDLIEKMQCTYCGKQLRGKYNMQKHIQRMHLEPGKVYRCAVCGHESPNSIALEDHRKRVHTDAQHECEQCGKRFKRKINLTEHTAALHTRKPLYECAFCEATFNSKANYYNHRKMRHTTEWEVLKQQKKAKEMNHTS